MVEDNFSFLWRSLYCYLLCLLDVVFDIREGWNKKKNHFSFYFDGMKIQKNIFLVYWGIENIFVYILNIIVELIKAVYICLLREIVWTANNCFYFYCRILMINIFV